MKVTYYVASSLDGYIARADGDVSWLDELGISMEETGYEEYFDTVDGLVMGRKTYEFVYDYGFWPYGEKPTWVCTTSRLNVIDGCNLQNASNPIDIMKEAEVLGIKHLWLVGGGELAGSFIGSKLLTHLSISQMPIILGNGIRLFGKLEKPVHALSHSCQPAPSLAFLRRRQCSNVTECPKMANSPYAISPVFDSWGVVNGNCLARIRPMCFANIRFL